MKETDLHQLFQRYIEGRYSKEELDRVLAAFAEGTLDEDELLQIFGELGDEAVDSILVDHIAANVERNLPITVPTKTRKYTWLPYAAAIWICLGIGLYFYISHLPPSGLSNGVVATNDVAPGTNKASLILDGGKSIRLDEDKSQIVSLDGRIAYANGESVDPSLSDRTMFTLVTPRGGQYQAVLPDGTKVWLNAASSISFPQQFAKNERVVEVQGELFLEVVHDADRPFKVKMDGQLITVKGTSFNIHAYKGDQYSYTTLLTGKIDVLTDRGKILQLVPGQMLSNDGIEPKISQANIESVVAWKNGYFLFDKEPLQQVMQQVSRWYDVEVNYVAGEPVEEIFGGSIPRDVTLRTLLDVLETTGDVKFTVEGKRILVHP